MCLAKAYLKSDSSSELLLESLTSVEILDNKIVLTTIFGEAKEIEASIKKVDFKNSSIILEENAEMTALT